MTRSSRTHHFTLIKLLVSQWRNLKSIVPMRAITVASRAKFQAIGHRCVQNCPAGWTVIQDRLKYCSQDNTKGGTVRRMDTLCILTQRLTDESKYVLWLSNDLTYLNCIFHNPGLRLCLRVPENYPQLRCGASAADVCAQTTVQSAQMRR